MDVKGLFVMVLFLLCSTTSAYDIPWVKDYIVVRRLGSGFFGDTWLLRNETDNTEYVLKKIKSELSTNDVDFHLSGVREMYFGNKLQNAMSTPGKDHIGRFIKHFDDGYSIQLISIFEGSGLKKLLYKDIKDQGATPSDWWVWMRTTPKGKIVMKSLIHQLLLGVKFCNDNNIVHRDIKPSNIVVCFEKINGSCSAVVPSHTLHTHLRLVDFGSAVDDLARKFLYGISGPTRLASMAEQCIGLPDFIEQEKMKKLNTCTENGYADYIRDRDPLHLGFPDVQLLRLVRLLLEADPDSRIGVDEALDHPYFTSSASIGTFHYCIPLVLCLVICIFGWLVLKICSNQWSKKGEDIKKKRN